jgi:hypothetical protein
MGANNPVGNNVPGSVVNVATSPKKCKPFIFDAMVYQPEKGYKAVINVERGCTPANDAIWKFVFDLYKKKATGDGFDQLVHVSYRGLNQQENQAIVGMIDGLNDEQADALPALHDASKNFSNNPTPETKTAVLNAAKGVVSASNEDE